MRSLCTIRERSSDGPLMGLAKMLRRVGIAADHGGYELKEQLAGKLRAAGQAVVEFGDCRLSADDDYPDFVVPLARRSCQRRGGARRGHLWERGWGIGRCEQGGRGSGLPDS